MLLGGAPAQEPPAPSEGNITMPDLAPAPAAATPAEATEPPRPQPPPLRLLPPLSLKDCIARIEAVSRALPPDYATDKPDEVPMDSYLRAIESAANYLKLRNDLHTTLAEYQWTTLGRQGVDHERGRTDRDVFDFDPPIRRVSALSFEAHGVDVLIHHLVVYDEKGDVRETFDSLRDNPRRLLHSLPLREVFHLWRRTTVSRVDIEYSRLDHAGEAEVSIFGGETERPEHVKTALHHLGLAMPQMRAGNWFAARSELLNARDAVSNHLKSAE